MAPSLNDPDSRNTNDNHVEDLFQQPIPQVQQQHVVQDVIDTSTTTISEDEQRDRSPKGFPQPIDQQQQQQRQQQQQQQQQVSNSLQNPASKDYGESTNNVPSSTLLTAQTETSTPPNTTRPVDVTTNSYHGNYYPPPPNPPPGSHLQILTPPPPPYSYPYPPPPHPSQYYNNQYNHQQQLPQHPNSTNPSSYPLNSTNYHSYDTSNTVQPNNQLPFPNNNYPHNNTNTSTNYYNPDQYYNNQEGDDTGADDPFLSTTKLVTATTGWVALGSILGITAAATVRWLNGGDFTLFPPPSIRTSSSTMAASNSCSAPKQEQHGGMDSSTLEGSDNNKQDVPHNEEFIEDNNQEEYEEYYEDDDQEEMYYDEDESDIDDGGNESKNNKDPVVNNDVRIMKDMIETKVLSMLQAIQLSSTQQENLLRRYVTELDRHRTNQAMELLKQHDATNRTTATKKVEQQQPLQDDATENSPNEPTVAISVATLLSVQETLDAIVQDLKTIQNDDNSAQDTETTISYDTASSTPENSTVSDGNGINNESIPTVMRVSKVSTIIQKVESVITCLAVLDQSGTKQAQSPSIPATQTTSASTVKKENDSENTNANTQPCSETDATKDDTTTVPIEEANNESQESSIPTPTSVLCDAIVTMVLCNDDLTKLKTALPILYLYVSNIAKYPQIPKYRKIHTPPGSAYEQQIKSIQGGHEFILAVGFVEQTKNGSSGNDGVSVLLEWDPVRSFSETLGKSTSTNTLSKDDIEASYTQLALHAAAAVKTMLDLFKKGSFNNTTRLTTLKKTFAAMDQTVETNPKWVHYTQSSLNPIGEAPSSTITEEVNDVTNPNANINNVELSAESPKNGRCDDNSPVVEESLFDNSADTNIDDDVTTDAMWK